MKSKEIYVEASLCFLPASHEKSHEHIFLSMTKQKASGGDENPAELFQILEDDAVKVLHSICQQIWKTQQWPQDWKRSVFIPIPKGNAKEGSNYYTTALYTHASKVMLKILQARPHEYVIQELPDVQDGFRKGRGTRDKIANILWIIEKARRVPEKHHFCFTGYSKALTVWITTNCGKFCKRREYQPPDLYPKKSVCRSRSNS